MENQKELVQDIIEKLKNPTIDFIERGINLDEESDGARFYSKIDIENIKNIMIETDDEILDMVADYIRRYLSKDDLFDDNYTLLDAILCDIVYTYFMSEQYNLVKTACEILNITQKELASLIGSSKPTVERWSQSGDIPLSAQQHLQLLLENQLLKKENKEIKQALSILKKYA